MRMRMKKPKNSLQSNSFQENSNQVQVHPAQQAVINQDDTNNASPNNHMLHCVAHIRSISSWDMDSVQDNVGLEPIGRDPRIALTSKNRWLLIRARTDRYGEIGRNENVGRRRDEVERIKTKAPAHVR